MSTAIEFDHVVFKHDGGSTPTLSGLSLSIEPGERANRDFILGVLTREEEREHIRLAVKSIESLGRAGVFATAVPEARIVHIVRHPCGYVASVLRGEQQKRFGHNEAASDFELYRMACETPQAGRYGLTLEKFRSMPAAERLAWRWVIYNEKAADELSGNPRAMTLYYEELCARPPEIARALFQFVELDWHSQSQQFVASSTSDSRSDYYSVFKNPLESAWRWRNELGPAEAERVLAVVAHSPVARSYLEPRDWNRAA
jgi:hypothetical protein